MSLRGGIGLPELPLEDGQEFRLGIMGGTFDPIHYGHLVTAEQARESLDLDAVLFMPAGTPAFKLDKPVTPAEDRYAMTVLATAANGPTPAIAEASVMRRTISGGGAEQDSGTGTRLCRNSGCSTIHASSSPRSVRTRAAKASLKPSGRGDTAVTRRSVSPITS